MPPARDKRLQQDLREFGAAVVAARQELGWTQEQLAVECQLARSYVADIERGSRNVSLRNILRLCRVLETTPGAVGWSIVDGAWEKDPDRFPVVEYAHQLRADGHTLKEIATRFNAENIPNGGGFGKWHATSVSRLLKAPLHAPDSRA